MEISASRRVPVALYVATGEQDAAELLVDYCRQYAASRDWIAVEAVTDTDRQAPLESRPGWARICELVSAAAVRGVVTYSATMLAEPVPEFEAVRTRLRDGGVFLVAARSLIGNPTAPTRRTPGQVARRQGVADAASGYEGCGAEWEALQ
ncbi:recombinase family protein [Streptomyces sp. NPDC090442]|uniref:recombinase family protein n=1 Tax=Streptomyces sp. NPDC090442 TaxID=3365962 RepID=UPI00382E3B49